MQKKIRYSGGGKAPSLSFPPEPTTTTYNIRKGRRVNYLIPDSVTTSGTSNARKCFVEREFSEKLQHFMLNYALTLSRATSLSGEI